MIVPYSKLYDDIYFSQEGGLEETEHVFFNGNRLQEKFTELYSSPNPREIFTIAETGFGTGLNFFATWKLWNEIQKTFHGNTESRKYASDASDSEERNPDIRPVLFYISVEAHPLSREEIFRYISPLFTLRKYMKEFLETYNLPSPGFFRFPFWQDNIVLQILYGGMEEVLPDLHANVDAWFLDGFSPAKNPDMWSPTLYSEMARLSHANTSFATYTSASFVRRGLAEAGFEVSKQPGFGKKREMSLGFLKENSGIDKRKPNHHSSTTTTPSNYCSCESKEKIPDGTEPIHIAGAGIAGSSVNFSLNQRGFKTIVWDGKGKANQGSGNPAGIFYPYLTKFPIPASRFSLSAFYYALQYLKLPKFREASGKIGLDFYLSDEKKKNRYLSSLREFAIPKEMAEFRADPDRIVFGEGRTLYPRKLIECLLDNPLTKFIQKNLSTENPSEESHNPTIYCTAFDVNALHCFQESSLPILKKVRGQIARISGKDLKNPPTHSICGDTYISPLGDGTYIVGSTYDEFHPDRGWSSEEDEKILMNLEKLTKLKRNKDSHHWNAWIEKRNKLAENYIRRSNSENQSVHFRVSHRAQTKDRYPMIGKIGKSWVYTGLGSRGLVTSLLGAEIIVSLMLGEPLPVPFSVYQGLSPERFSKKTPS